MDGRRDEDLLSEVCFVTADLARAAARWAEIAGAGPFYEFPSPPENLWVRGEIVSDHFRAALGFSGRTIIELIQPGGSTPSIFTEVLAEKGEGAVHHLFPDIRPLDAAAFDARCLEYEQRGLPKVMEFSVPGMGRNRFYDARAELGCYLEVLEGGEIVTRLAAVLHAAHCRRDGGPALRSFDEIAGSLGLLPAS